MKKKIIINKVLFLHICLSIILLTKTEHALSSNTVPADPDHIATGFEYRGVTDIRLGDSFGIKNLNMGGMVDIRNESRFNQKILPNHNWRGFAFVHLDYSPADTGSACFITLGLEHESAHPTMGLNDGNNKAYDKIYDGTYRTLNLNSLMLRINSSTGSGYKLTVTGDFRFYYLSRNTPELPVNDLTWSEGVSGGAEFLYPVTPDFSLYISIFDRYIFQSRKKVTGDIYYDTDTVPETRSVEYHLINSVNTVSAKTGLIFNNIISGRKISLYCGILYGNIYGFVDSREKRTVYSIGIEITR